ncbi:MAG: glutamine amidotransferase [Luteibaculaceae bacterium]|jgi:glutamine amidotransferase
MVGIIEYTGGNATSVKWALDAIGVPNILSSDPDVLSQCDRLIFPGVGAAPSAKKGLEVNGLWSFVQTWNKPFLGICLGMQLLFDGSDEGNTTGLGVMQGKVEQLSGPRKVNMGWRKLENTEGPLFAGIPKEAMFYFVHQFANLKSVNQIGMSLFGSPFSAAVQNKSFFGVQFHPEKSGKNGLQLLKNFATWKE